MHFEPSEEQRLIEQAARQFAAEVLRPKAAERDQKSLFPEAELRKLGELGLLGVNVPEQYGGSQAGVVAYSLALSQVAQADASVSVAMAVTNMVAEVICAFGTEEQKTSAVLGRGDCRCVCAVGAAGWVGCGVFEDGGREGRWRLSVDGEQAVDHLGRSCGCDRSVGPDRRWGAC